MNNNYSELVKQNMDSVITWRRHMHENPELSFQEVETTKYILDILSKLENVKIETPCQTGCIAILKGKQEGDVIGLRADIDALPVHEESDEPFISKTEGVFHACGHDVHTAMLLGVATILNDHVDQLKGTVKFIFQAAEEKQPGGAIEIVNSGILDDCKYIFGQHIMPSIPTGKVALKDGTIFGSSDRVYIDIQGKGGHAAMPQTTIDPVVVAAEIIMGLQTIVSRKATPLYNPVISTTVVRTPVGAENVIPDTISMQCSVRNIDLEVRQNTATWIKQVVEGIAMAHGASAKVDFTFGYAPVFNSTTPYQIAVDAAKAFVPEEDVIILKDPIQAGEDFCNYNKVCECEYFLVGSGNEEKGTTASPHNPKYKADEDAMYYGMMMYLNIVDKILAV